MSNIMLTDKPRTGESVPRFFEIPNFENYVITKTGKIFNKQTGKQISTYIGIDNYEHCVLFKKGRRYRKRVHRLMGKTFLGNPTVINHIDGDKSNNNLSNLERSTHSANIQHAYDNGYYKSTTQVGVIITNKTTQAITEAKSMREAERITGIDRHRIKTFIIGSRPNHTNWDFKYKE